MSDETIIANDVLIDLSGLSLDDLPEFPGSRLLGALRRILSAPDESDVVAEWPNCT
jgi:hypothetical protein